MRSVRQFLVVVSVLALAACANVNQYSRTGTGGTDRANTHLDRAAAILVMTPKDAARGEVTYKGSGDILARMIDASFSRYARLVDVYPGSYVSIDQVKGTVAEHSYGYLVVPTVLAWGPKDDDWYNAVNQATVKILVLDALTGAEVSSNILDGQGPALAQYNPFNMQTAGPEGLLAKPITDYVDYLYAK